MKAILSYIQGNPELNNTIQKIANIFSNISKDNMKTLTITGKCGTIISGVYYSTVVTHNSHLVPSFVFIYDGDVIIPKNGIGPEDITVKSRNSAEEFTLIVVF